MNDTSVAKTIKEQRAQAAREYVEAAALCWKAWRKYMDLGGYDDCLGYARFFLPSPAGYPSTVNGSLFDPETPEYWPSSSRRVPIFKD